ncbi:helix-turn-helix domain-containing protein [Limosilactobacillus fermentum]|uniref:helix-turn-helix domain-containing protein n=1 Tax=Limosilactobacillus fermentum TaxID=1613 RepID=UPI003892A1E2
MAEYEGANLFLNIPVRVAHDNRLKDKDKLLYGEIYAMLNVTNSFFMSNAAMAKRFNCTNRTIISSLNRLEEYGYIRRKNIYEGKQIIRREIMIGSKADFTGVVNPVSRGYRNSLHGGSDADFTDNRTINRASNRAEEDILSGKPDDHLSENFEAIWKEYPNKAGKKEAFKHYKKWRKESKEHTDEYLMEKLAAYKQDLATNQWKKPMNGSTWFNGRFDDEYATPIMDQQPNRAKGYQF